MTNLLSRLRDSDFLNLMLRYNAPGSARARQTARRYADANEDERRRIRSRLTDSTIRDAQKTQYGQEYGDSIDAWPVLGKDRLRENPDDFRGPALLCVEAGTGGTTGQPVRLFRSIASIAIERSFIEGLVRPFGVSLKSSRVAVLRADEVKDPQETSPPFGVYRFGGRHLILSNPHLNRDTVAWYVDAIKQHETQILYVYPSMLENLIDLSKADGLSLRVPIVLSSSETVAPALFDRVRQTLGGTLVDYYGLGERVALAAVDSSGGYYFDPVYGRVELVETGEPEDDGRAFYRIVASGHWNSAMPLVRYDTGDIAIVNATDKDRLAEIEIGERAFVGIRGRDSEFVSGSDGSRISGLNHLPRGVDNLVRMQVVQHSLDLIEIRLRVTDDFSRSDLKRLRANVDAMLPPSMSVEINENATLEKAANGKTPFVIHKAV